MAEGIKIIKGNIVFTPSFGQLEVFESSFILIEGKTV